MNNKSDSNKKTEAIVADNVAELTARIHAKGNADEEMADESQAVPSGSEAMEAATTNKNRVQEEEMAH